MKEEEQEKKDALCCIVWASEDFTTEKIENVLKFKY